MAEIRDEYILDIDRALRSIGQLQTELRQAFNSANRTATIDVDVKGIDSATRNMGQLDREVDDTADSFRRLEREAEDSSDAVLRVGSRGVSVFSNLRGSVAAVAAGFAAFQGAAAFGRFAFDAIQSASDLQESLSKTNVVFGSLSKQIEGFAATAPQALGLSTAAALESTATFGNLFVALGLSQQAAAELSPDIVQLAADLASFNNIAVDEAVQKLRSGLVGEVEPLRTLGVNLNAATVDAKAMALGFTDANGVVTEAGKVQARYALILEQTTTAQGDYARTADGIANSQRTLTAEFENAKTALGNALLPAFRSILEQAPELIGRLEEIGPAIGLIASAATESLGPVTDFVSLLGNVISPIAGLADELSGVEGADPGGIFDRITTAVKNSLNPIGAFNEGIKDIDARLSGINPTALADQIDLITEAIARGRDPIIILNQEFTEFVEHSNITADALTQLTTATGISDEALATFLSTQIRNAGRLKLSAAEIRVLKDALNALFEVQRRQPGGGGGTQVDQFVKGKAAVDAYRASITALSSPLEQLQQVAQESGVSVGFISQNTELFGSNVASLVAQAGGGTLAVRELSDAFGSVADSLNFDTSSAVEEFDLLINKTNEAGEKVPQSVAQMIADLQAQANQLATIEAGTAILEALGFDDLAAEIRTKDGPEAVAAVEKFLADLPGAAEAERILDEGGNPGQAYIDGINEAIATGNVTPELLALIGQFTSDEVKRATLNAALTTGNLFGSNLQAVLNALKITLPASFIQVNTSGFEPPPGFVPPPPPPPPPRGDVGRGELAGIQLNQEINTTAERERADVARATQIAGATIANMNNFVSGSRVSQ